MNASGKRNSVLAWLDDRTGLPAAMRKCSEGSVPGGVGWRHVLPGTILFAFLVQAITGFFLWMFYSPSTQTAWESVYYVQHEVAGGWLLRGIHHYNAQVLVALIGLYFLGIILAGAYRRPREFVYWTVVLMGLCALGGCLTGDLLPWDQNSYHATKTRVDFLNLLPLVGGPLQKLATGGPEFGHHTLTRFFALHVGIFGGGFLLLLLLHRWFSWRAEATLGQQAESFQTSGVSQTSEVSPGASPTNPHMPGGAYWPDQMLRNMIGAVAVMAVVLLLVFQHGLTGEHAGQPPADYLGARLGAPGDLDPTNAYGAARPEWSFRGLYAFSNLFPGEMKIVPIFIVPGVIMLFVFAMPLVAAWRPGHLLNVGAIGALLLGVVVLSCLSWVHDWLDPGYQADVAEAKVEARRAVELVEMDGVPRDGALALMATDPEIQGRRLFRAGARCVACHDHAGPEGTPIHAEETSAPNLAAFASRQRVAGLLDPERIVQADYFGNTKLRAGDMADFVKDNLAELDEFEKEEVEMIAMAVSAEARLPSQAEADKADAKKIEEGRELIVDYGCTDCHKFRDEGSLGDAPDLTGYGSKQWLVGVISDPTQQRFYGEKNDRMPSYKDSLTPRQIEWLAEWLRGEWPVPADAPADEP
jgi:ubiquinol-cytochrome c reductase cytochrome b subunit